MSIDVVDRVTDGVESMMPCLLNGQLMYMECNIEPHQKKQNRVLRQRRYNVFHDVAPTAIHCFPRVMTTKLHNYGHFHKLLI